MRIDSRAMRLGSYVCALGYPRPPGRTGTGRRHASGTSWMSQIGRSTFISGKRGLKALLLGW